MKYTLVGWHGRSGGDPQSVKSAPAFIAKISIRVFDAGYPKDTSIRNRDISGRSVEQGFASLYGTGIYISEPDKGIYDALNKALSLILGKWVIFLGAGDTLIDTHTIEKCIPLLAAAASDITIAYGGVLWVTQIEDSDGYLCYEHWRGIDGPWIAARPAMPSHQGIFHHSSLFSNGFRFDTRFRIAADGELVLRTPV